MLSHLWRQHLGGGPNDQVSFATLADDPVAAFRELVVLGYYPVLTWLTYLLAGLAIGRSDLRSVATAVRLVAIGVVAATLAWCTSALLMAGGVANSLIPPEAAGSGIGWWDFMSTEGKGTTPTDSWGWLAMAAPHTGTPFDLIGTTGSAMAILGLCLLAVRVDWLRVLSHPVAAAGSMTLTLYTLHVLALAQPWGEWDSVTYYLTHVVVALTFASLWLWWLPKGPMEWMVHTISSGVATMLVPPVPSTPRPPPAPHPPRDHAQMREDRGDHLRMITRGAVGAVGAGGRVRWRGRLRRPRGPRPAPGRGARDRGSSRRRPCRRPRCRWAGRRTRRSPSSP